MQLFLTSLLICLCSLLSLSIAQTETSAPVSSQNALMPGWSFHMSLGRVSITEAPSQSEAIGQNGWSWIRMGGGISAFKYVVAEAGFGIFSFKDNDEFRQWVTGGVAGNIPRQATSEISSGELYYAAGLRTRPLGRFMLEGLIGQSRVRFRRTIPLCTNCERFDLNVEGGSYVQLRLGFGNKTRTRNITNGFGGFYVSYRRFLGDAQINEMFLFGIALHYD